MCSCSPADTTDKALGVVRASQSGDHLSGDEGVTAVAACAVQTLVVCRANVLALLLEEARSSQITVTHCGESGKVRARGQRSEDGMKTDLWMSASTDINKCVSYSAIKSVEQIHACVAISFVVKTSGAGQCEP